MNYIEDLIEFFSCDEDVTNIAFFQDKNKNLELIIIKEVRNIINFEAYNKEYDNTGYMDIWIYPNNRIRLSRVYCYEKYRSLGIASILSDLLDYTLKDYNGALIDGYFTPNEMSTDRIYGKVDKDILNKRAYSFYKKNNFEIVSYIDYINNKNKYPYINLEYDFLNIENTSDTKIFKQVTPKQSYEFTKVGNILVHKNALKNANIQEYINKQTALKKLVKS